MAIFAKYTKLILIDKINLIYSKKQYHIQSYIKYTFG